MRAASVTAGLALVLLTACSGSGSGQPGQTGQTISASSYDQECTKPSDCVPIATGLVTCCGFDGCDNAAINKSDESKYEADLEADHPANCTGVACPEIACETSPVGCVGGKCKILPFGSGDAGNGDSGKHD